MMCPLSLFLTVFLPTSSQPCGRDDHTHHTFFLGGGVWVFVGGVVGEERWDHSLSQVHSPFYCFPVVLLLLSLPEPQQGSE